jgi:dolichol-phosphate mannosyltransferase
MHLAVAIPAYNEAEGIVGFLEELDRELKPVAREVTFVVVDDCSTDGTLDVLARLGPTLNAELVGLRNDVNAQHGPTLLRAYRAALGTGADVIAQVDGDGQFTGHDLAMIVRATADATIALGVRAQRVDPWFRKLLTRGLRAGLVLLYGVHPADANCPLRAFPAPALSDLLDNVIEDAFVPNVHLSVLALASDRPVIEMTVDHLERRGECTQGTMWGAKRAPLIPKRLVVFSARAAQETLGLALVWRAHQIVGRRDAIRPRRS